jgi:glycosyltransferase involved in cell wall biosynthesis
MRILWFTHFPCDALNRHFGRPANSSGYWIQSLIEPLAGSGEVELCIATATPGMPACHFSDAGVEYVNIPQHKILDAYGLFQEYRLSRYLRQCATIIDRWKPDAIHVHGTERLFGLVRARVVSIPTVVSLQGIISEVRRFAWGTMTLRDLFSNTTIWDLTHNATLIADSLRYRRQAAIEQEILQAADAVIGRTEWDRAHAREFNPTAPYFHVDEMMRPPFRDGEPWSLGSVCRGTVAITASPAPLKGLPVLLKAMATLRSWGHDVRLKIAGLSGDNRRGTSKYLFKLIKRLKLEDSVDLLGWCDAATLAGHMRQAHCYVSASLIENSSNAISEAQLLGMPVVAAHTGGTPTLVHDENTGLLFSRGDAVMLARQIERILEDDNLATDLAQAARAEARRRHDPGRIIADLLTCYRALVHTSDSSNSGAKAGHLSMRS